MDFVFQILEELGVTADFKIKTLPHEGVSVKLPLPRGVSIASLYRVATGIATNSDYGITTVTCDSSDGTFTKVTLKFSVT